MASRRSSLLNDNQQDSRCAAPILLLDSNYLDLEVNDE